ncbi:MAG TPA: hypothetical protein VE400_20145 [Mycobacterium sp.]|nr:hypothetical protein [Mycobacterium sp.]
MKRIVATAIAVAALLLSSCSPSQVLNGAEPNNLAITTTRSSVATWCQTLGTPDNKISDMPHV